MRERWILVGVLALAVLTLGCVGTSDEAPDAGDAEPNAEEDASGVDERRSSNASVQDVTNASREPRGPIVHHLNDSFTAEAVNLGVDSADRSLELDVPAGAQAIVAELRWEGTADLDLGLWPSSFCHDTTVPEPVGGAACRVVYYATGQGDSVYATDRTSPSVQENRLEVRVGAGTIAEEDCGEDVCEWWAHVNPNAAVETAFELRASVFPDAPPAESYSAFDDG